ncbi:hypothetical protein Tco_1039381, partial [Tanacetum coccineum]
DKKVDQELLNKRIHVMNSLQDLEKLEMSEIAQKVKINWSIEGDENSRFFHGMLNKKRNQHAIRGILTEGIWIQDPNSVKNEFLSHFKERFDSPCSSRLMLDVVFPNRLNAKQNLDLERNVSNEEIKRAVWDCGIDKSPGPDGFTFGFYRRYWDTIKKDVVNAVHYFFTVGTFPKGGNASFIALIPKMQDANWRVGNGLEMNFWEDVWMGDKKFKSRFPRVYALESDKKITVATKMNHNDVGFSLRRLPRDGVEME